MAHLDAMLERLPQLYRDGALVRQILALLALQLEILDEDALAVQRSHWFDATLDLDEAARLAALLDIPPESWQSLGEYRAWVHALRDARLELGAVTPQAIKFFVEEYSSRFLDAVAPIDIKALHPVQSWSEEPSTHEAAFVEYPLRRRYDRVPDSGGLEPLQQFTIVQRGLDEAQPGFLLTGLPAGPESVPVIANLTTGQAIIYLGNIPPGARLWIRPVPGADRLEAHLEQADVSDRLRSVAGMQAGTAWAASQVSSPARALTLQRGQNDLWFLPVAHFNAEGLDRALLALADLLMTQGRYDQTTFDHALFYQEPAVNCRITWLERQAGAFEVHLPGQALLSEPGHLDDALEARNHLEFSLNSAVQSLKAAGVEASVQFRPAADLQPQMDSLIAILPLHHREVGPTGIDRLPDAGGMFEVTHFEDSTFR